MPPTSSDNEPIVTYPTATQQYRAAVTAVKAVWAEPAIDPWTQNTEVWVSRALRQPDGMVLAVVSATVMLSDLSARLNQLPTGSDGEVYLLSRDRQVMTSRAAGNLSVDVDTTHTATAEDGDVWGTSDDKITLERGLGVDGVDWVLHLRASTSGLNRGFDGLVATLRWITEGTALLTVALG